MANDLISRLIAEHPQYRFQHLLGDDGTSAVTIVTQDNRRHGFTVPTTSDQALFQRGVRYGIAGLVRWAETGRFHG